MTIFVDGSGSPILILVSSIITLSKGLDSTVAPKTILSQEQGTAVEYSIKSFLDVETTQCINPSTQHIQRQFVSVMVSCKFK